MSATVEGGYVTRGRAAELQREIDELRGDMCARIDVLERRVAAAEGLALEVVRAMATSTLELYKGLQATHRKDGG